MAYLKELKSRCDDLAVKSVLIMCDGEGQLGDADEGARTKAVENHYRWITAAQYLSGILSGIGADAHQNTLFIGYKLSVFKHVVPRAGIEPALP